MIKNFTAWVVVIKYLESYFPHHYYGTEFFLKNWHDGIEPKLLCVVSKDGRAFEVKWNLEVKQCRSFLCILIFLVDLVVFLSASGTPSVSVKVLSVKYTIS